MRRATVKTSPFESVITNLLEQNDLLLNFCLSRNFRAVQSVEGYGSLVVERKGMKILVRLEQVEGSTTISAQLSYPSWMPMIITVDGNERKRYSDNHGKLVIDKQFDRYANPLLEKWAQAIEMLFNKGKLPQKIEKENAEVI